MIMLTVLTAGLLASGTMAGPIGVDDHVEYSTCANADPTPEEQKLFARQQQQRPRPKTPGSVTLPVSFSYCCPQPEDCPFDEKEMGQAELALLNKYYKDAGITWVLSSSVKLTDDPKCQSLTIDNKKQQLEALKKETRKGGSEELNILYLPSNQGAGKKGECINPRPGSQPPPKTSGNIVDSCVVAMDTLPGQKGNGGSSGGSGGRGFPGFFRRQQGQNGGGIEDITSVHEAGHWLALPHVDQNSSGGKPGTQNVMEPAQVVGAGVEYSFTAEQNAIALEMALARQSVGNSTNGAGRGNRKGDLDFPDVIGFPDLPESGPGGVQGGQGPNGKQKTPGLSPFPQGPTRGNGGQGAPPSGQGFPQGLNGGDQNGFPSLPKGGQSGPQGIPDITSITGLDLDDPDAEITVIDATDLE
ncbi:hypothetical protein HIM_10064 [Hirsutella minnesotensis 3608]|uniref:Peptidase M43 pregnancy-associated plasma-A domain-containing protein n=1 Tax=Hirsutella minnesotensis 3608 TaxID=1043627 RepID=A0A0F7ZGA7_9HYPO|nr:hypothetical protein HIM_10064 [Hirsutella minnesotensis 3608]